MVAKYILNPDAKKGDTKGLEPEWGKLEEVGITSRAGKVRSLCGAVYVAFDNQVK